MASILIGAKIYAGKYENEKENIYIKGFLTVFNMHNNYFWKQGQLGLWHRLVVVLELISLMLTFRYMYIYMYI